MRAFGVMGKRTLSVMVSSAASLALVPWIIYLGWTLPRTHVTRNWDGTWVGFDIVLALALLTTAVTGWQRRHSAVLFATVTATLLLCDAWFDLATSTTPSDQADSLTSLLVELPLAVLLLTNAALTLRRLGRE